MAPTAIRRGQRVTVRHEPPREDRTAIVIEAPPFEDHDGTERTDSVLVEYPNTTSNLGALFGNMRERIDLDRIDVE